ncbi:hypothetical protein [Methyloversatilis universalis]|nr:hypothetical protein [Methyloversatilis universalis]
MTLPHRTVIPVADATGAKTARGDAIINRLARGMTAQSTGKNASSKT